MRPRDGLRARGADYTQTRFQVNAKSPAKFGRLDCYCITRYKAVMTPDRPTLLQMSASARLVLALGACALVWAIIALALV